MANSLANLINNISVRPSSPPPFHSANNQTMLPQGRERVFHLPFDASLIHDTFAAEVANDRRHYRLSIDFRLMAF